jgi:hypothetical protein
MPRFNQPEYEGDSRPDTQKHIDLVNENGRKFCDKFLKRLTRHDASKLEEPERKYFDKGTPQLKNSTYGDKSYDDAKDRIKPGLEHHYASNDHHPEHFGEQGISGMNLYQLLEMWIDWTAAVKRHADGNIFNSLMYNRDRFHIDDQLFSILMNTATEDFPDQMDTANEKFQKYLEAEINRDATDEENTDAGSDS